MKPPPKIDTLVALVEDLARGEASASGVPLRIEGGPEAAPWEHLPDTLEDRVVVLALRGSLDTAALERVRDLALPHTRWIALELDLAQPPKAWPQMLAPLLVRLELVGTLEDYHSGATRSFLRQVAAARPAGLVRAKIRYAGDADAAVLARARACLELLHDTCGRSVEVRFLGIPDHPELGTEAARLGLHVAAEGDAPHLFGPALDPNAPWNVLDETLRAAFRRRPSLCPFPWTMLRLPSSTAPAGLCPKADGPTLNPEQGLIQDWASGAGAEVRAAFLAGEPPKPCGDCTLQARVMASIVTSGVGAIDNEAEPPAIEV